MLEEIYNAYRSRNESAPDDRHSKERKLADDAEDLVLNASCVKESLAEMVRLRATVAELEKQDAFADGVRFGAKFATEIFCIQ
jgi:hypothetical protein